MAAAILVVAAAGIGVWFFKVRKRPERAKASDLEANHSSSSRRAWFLPLNGSRKGQCILPFLDCFHSFSLTSHLSTHVIDN